MRVLETWLSPACRQAGVESGTHHMYYVYILRSEKDGNLYIGKTNNVERRLKEHNGGHTVSTKNRAPFSIFKIITCENEESARQIEKEYKKGYKREELKREIIGDVAEWPKAAPC